MSKETGTSGWRGAKVAFQLFGFLLGIALLGFAVRLAFSEQNRESINKLTEAPPGMFALLVGLSLVPLIVNGVVYRLLIRSLQRISVLDLLATNALCTFLAYLPFKIGMLTRVAIHRKRDRVPIPRIGAWFGAFLLVYLPTLGVVVLVTRWRGEADWVWWVVTLALTAVSAWPVAWMSGLLEGQRGLGRIRGFAEWAHLPMRERLLHTPSFEHLHDGFTMTADTGAVAWSGLLRVLDFAAQSFRFMAAAALIGLELSFGDSLILTVSYFMIGLATPIGMIGTREAGAVAIAAVLGLGGGEPLNDEMVDQFALVMVIVTGAEAIATAAAAGMGLAWLRPDRLLRAASGEPEPAKENRPATETADSIPDADRPAGNQPDGR